MPPKAKFTKEEIISAALSIVRENGFDALTARALGAKLGSSSRPIFTVFQSMDDVQTEVIAAATQLYNSYIREAFSKPQESGPHFKHVGKQYIRFAISEPKLFQLLFMKEQSMLEFANILPAIDMNYEEILSSIKNEYSLDDNASLKLYQHLWVYTHGIASLCATRMCRFTGEEIGQMMTEVFTGLLKEAKGVNKKND